VPALTEGSYIGIDISSSMLGRARARVAKTVPSPGCRVSWLKQTTDEFSLAVESVDLMCAFSVFTHMEHEDAYRYLVAARRIVRPGGRFIFSCLPMSLEASRQIFQRSALLTMQQRWRKVRNVTTSVEMMDAICTLAGWQIVRWYDGTERTIVVPGEAENWAFGQSACVLRRD
jgi:ubiquinone/menaquinone biosynthesis C-methylase UbiE